MNPFFNEDHESIREMARDFAEKALAPIAADIDKNEHFPEEVVKQMADLGFLGLKIPEAYGGLGLDMRSYVCVMEEIAKKCATATLFISSANSLSTAPIVISGTEEQKQRYLPGVASGEEYIAFGLTEPNAGSDAASMTTRAVEDGDFYILNGRKCFITMAPISKYTIVYAKTNPEKGAKGISCFMVDMSLPGVSCGRHEEKMGQRGVPVSDVVLEDVRVPKECMIGEKDLGFINAMKTLSVGRIGVASMCLGMAAEAIELAVNHTKNRVQFGKPLCKHQAIAFMLADMETKLNAARGLVYNAAWLMDNKQPADKAASMAKYFAAEAAIDIINKSLQLHGGYGYSREYEIERLYRDVRVCSIYEGSSQVQQIVISGQMLK
ncbi:acyl-CoA dehydrogenase family protein [Intestinimonas sp.]|uniref:acyl-CoA dehydrogenase family protein n=1 Tax=Intestinimonas sp. TaxID=1965293 RepID=UPI00260F303E|nr:acyl-CoA dehydrogenase family protein [Intestinimonas sp.]